MFQVSTSQVTAVVTERVHIDPPTDVFSSFGSLEGLNLEAHWACTAHMELDEAFDACPCPGQNPKSGNATKAAAAVAGCC